MMFTWNFIGRSVAFTAMMTGARASVVFTNTELTTITSFRITTALKAFRPLETKLVHQTFTPTACRQAERTTGRDGLV